MTKNQIVGGLELSWKEGLQNSPRNLFVGDERVLGPGFAVAAYARFTRLQTSSECSLLDQIISSIKFLKKSSCLWG